jgi:sulfotransferase family protein
MPSATQLDSPSGARVDEPPVPITAANLWRWALLTWRAELAERRRFGRPGHLTLVGLGRSLYPRLHRPLFIVGAARSGTTFLGDSIAQLPEISYHHEPRATKAAGRYVYERLWGFRQSRWFYSMVYRWLLRTQFEGGLRFAEKTPKNSFLIPFLARAFPGSQFIHIVRDGRDAAVSHLKEPWLYQASKGSPIRDGPYAHWWVEPERRAEFESTTDLHRVIWAWRRYVEAVMRDGPALGAERYREVRYEALVADPRAEGERILDFLGISAARSRTAFLAALERAHTTSVGAWRAQLNPAERSIIEDEAGELLGELGYLE